MDFRVVEVARVDPRGRQNKRRRMARGGALAVTALAVVALGLIATGAVDGILKQLAAAGPPRVIRVTLTGTRLDPAVVLLEPGSVRFLVRNAGSASQRFVVTGPDVFAQTDELPPGAAARLDLTFAHPGTYTLRAGSAEKDSTSTLEVRP